MPIYFVDTRDDDDLFADEVGQDVPDLATAGVLATVSLCELAKDVLPDSDNRRLAVDVRDVRGRTVFTAELTFERFLLSEPSLPGNQS